MYVLLGEVIVVSDVVGLKVWGRAGSYNFLTEEILVFKIVILPLNSTKMGISSPKFIFSRTFSYTKKFFERMKFWRGSCHAATDRCVCCNR